MGTQAERAYREMMGLPQLQSPSTKADTVYNSLLSPDPYEEDENGEEEGFFKYVGNLAKYAVKTIFSDPYAQAYGAKRNKLGMEVKDIEKLKNLGGAITQVGKNLFDTENRDFGYKGTPIKEITKEVWGNLTRMMSGEGMASLPKGFLQMTVEPLLSAFTGTTKVGDTPVISTVSERAKAIQEVASLAAMGIGYEGTARLMASKLAPIGTKALVEQSAIRNVGKAALTAATASGAAGAAGGVVAGAGDEDILVKTISGVLASIPLGMVIGTPLFERVRVNNANLKAYATASKAQENLLDSMIHEWSSLYGLASSEQSPLQTLVNNIDSFGNSRGVVESILRSSVNNKQGWIVPQTDDIILGEALKGISKEPPLGPPKEWIDAPKGVKISNPTFFGMKVEWGSNFDKATYILSNLKSKAKSYPEIAEKIQKEFGISLDDAVAHGMYVRQSIKNMLNGGQIERLAQPEIDAVNRGIVQRGSNIISKIPDGGKIKDYNGVEWVRQGNTMTDGRLVYPVNDNSLIQTLGRKFQLDPLQGKIKLPALSFRPDFQRAVGDFHIYKHSTQNGKFDALISPVKLAKNHATFYEQTGFLPGEVVAVDGLGNGRILQRGSKPNTFLVATVKGGKGTRNISASRLQHHPDGIKSAVEGLDAFEATSESMFEKFVSNFRRDFEENIMKEEGQLSFDNIFERSRIKNGIPESQKQGLKLAVYRKLQNEYIDKLPENERAPLKLIRKELEVQESTVMESKSNRIHNFATGNNMYVRNKGGGSFELRQAADDKLIHTFGSMDDALTFLTKSGKNPNHSIDLDGGTASPSGIAELGGMAEPWVGPASTRWTQAIERFQVAPISRIFTSSQELFHSWAAIFDDTFQTGSYFKERIADWVKNNQVAAQANRRFHEFNSKEVISLYKDLHKAVKGMSKDDMEMVLGYVETLTPEEIRTGLANRPASTTELRKAIEWSNIAEKEGFSMFDVEDLFHAAEKTGGKVGTPEFEAAVNNLVKNGVEKSGKIVKANQSAANIVIDLGRESMSNLVGRDPFNKYLALRLADAYQHPTNALNRTQFYAKHKLTQKHKAAAEIFESLIAKAMDMADIPKSERINFHVPHIRMMKELNSWAETKMPEELLYRLSTELIGDNRTMVRDPMQIAHKIIEEVGRYKTEINVDGKSMNYNQFLNHSVTELDKLSTELNGYEARLGNSTNSGKILQKYGEKHLTEITGKSDESTLTRTFLRSFYKKLGYSDRASTDMTDMIAAATQGASQVMWIRDVSSAFGNAFSLFGHEFAGKAILTPVKKSVIESLERRGKIPIVGASDLASPQAVRMSGDLSNNIAKMADQALTLSGQHHIYRHRLAGIYIATEELVNKYSGQLQRREISKKMFYDNIGVDVHPRAVQTLVDKFISSGDTQAAIDYLAQQNTKRIMNLFGYANTPVGWTTSVGRLLGQYGSWGSNHIATALNSTRNLNSANGVKRMLRFSSFEGARLLAAQAAGLNLNSFTLLPNVPGIGPIGDITEEMQRITRAATSGSLDEALRLTVNTLPGVKLNDDGLGFSTDFGRLFVPYSYQTENILKALVDLPNEGYSPIQQALQGIGFRVVPPQQ